MASKKYLLVLATFIAVLGFTKVEAQNSGVYNLTSYDYTDSSLIPEKRMDQQNDFMNNRALYPAKPRNQWEVGLSFGGLNVSGDVNSKSIFNGAIKPMNTLGFGVHVRKAWGYLFSTRLQYIQGNASGYNYRPNSAASYTQGGSNNPWVNAGYTGNAYYNYCSSIKNLSLDLIASLNNIKYHTGKTKVAWYALAGLGGMLYETKVDVLDASNNRYNFGPISANNPGRAYENRKAINSDLKNLFDGEYESQAERKNNAGWSGDNTFNPSGNLGIGAQFRLGKNVTLSLEDKVIFVGDDLLDGVRWEERTSLTAENDRVNYLSAGLNVHLGNNAVAPLYWLNPNDFLYNAAANTKAPIDKCAPDSDGDGVSDCYDRCGDTPSGVAVDTHGCPLDTDGDGVADYKDKQLITPSECQPVNADGIGDCPCDPKCGTKVVDGCGSISNGSIRFAGGSRKLGSSAQNQLNNLANQMRSNPNCKAVITGNGSGSKVAQQRSWDRVNAVINYMVDRNGIDRGRFIFQYGQMGDKNTVDYRSAGEGESGPPNTPPPFPNLQRN